MKGHITEELSVLKHTMHFFIQGQSEMVSRSFLALSSDRYTYFVLSFIEGLGPKFSKSLWHS